MIQLFNEKIKSKVMQRFMISVVINESYPINVIINDIKPT